MKKDRIILDDMPFIDINCLHTIGAFSGGEQYFPYVTLQYPFLSKLRCFQYRCDMIMRHTHGWVLFPVEWTRCYYGGRRPWFRCTCGRRVGKIYCGGYFLGCRHCYNGKYNSQNAGSRAREHKRACQIRLSLGGEPAIRGPFPDRPRRMWRRTYDRLRREAQRLEAGLSCSRFQKRPPDYSKFRIGL